MRYDTQTENRFPALMLYFEDLDLLAGSLSAEDFRDTVLALRKLAETGERTELHGAAGYAFDLLRGPVTDNPKHIYVF